MSTVRWAAALFCLVSALGSARPAIAQRVQLDWRRPVASTCPSASILQQDVETILGRPVFSRNGSVWLQIDGRIDELERGVWVRLEAHDAKGALIGSRELEAQQGRCDSLRGAIAFALTLLIEHQSPPSDTSGNQLRLRPGVESSLLMRSLPRPVIGAGPLLSIGLGSRLHIELAAAYFWPTVLQSSRGIRVTLHTLSVTARICPRLASTSAGTLAVYACAGLQLGAWLALQSRGGSTSELRSQWNVLLELRAAIATLGSHLEVALAPLLALDRVAIYSVHGDSGAQVLLHRAPLLGLAFLIGFVI